MWSRRRFLESVAAIPALGGGLATTAATAEATALAKPARDYFRELGVRPFINAAGTYTAMTASLMPPEVMDAMTTPRGTSSRSTSCTTGLGERIATLVQAEAAMVTSGAASALTLGTAAASPAATARRSADLPNLSGMKSEVIIQKAHRFGYEHAVRNGGVQLVEVETPRRARARGERRRRR